MSLLHFISEFHTAVAAMLIHELIVDFTGDCRVCSNIKIILHVRGPQLPLLMRIFSPPPRLWIPQASPGFALPQASSYPSKQLILG